MSDVILFFGDTTAMKDLLSVLGSRACSQIMQICTWRMVTEAFAGETQGKDERTVLFWGNYFLATLQKKSYSFSAFSTSICIFFFFFALLPNYSQHPLVIWLVSSLSGSLASHDGFHQMLH